MTESSCTRSLQRVSSGARLGALGAFALRETNGSTTNLASLERRARMAIERQARLLVMVEADFDVACWVSLETGEVDGPDLPIIISGGSGPVVAKYVAEGEAISGTFVPEGFRRGIPFAVEPLGSTAGSSFVGQLGRLSTVVTVPSTLDSANAGGALLPAAALNSPGVSVDLRLSEEGSMTRIAMHIRLATLAEASRATRAAA